MTTQKFISPSVNVSQTETKLENGMVGQNDAATLEARWFKLLSRLALAAGLVLAAMFVLLPIMQSQSQDNALAVDYDELVWAMNTPVLYSLAMVFDMTVWVLLGGFFVAFAGLLARQTPVRSALIAACGAGQVAGIIGATMRLAGITDLAARYTGAAPDQQTIVLQAYLDLHQIIAAHFMAGSLLWSLGLVLVASVAFQLKSFPRWLAGLFVLTALTNELLDILTLVAGDRIPELAYLLALVLLLSIFFTVARVFWRGLPDCPPIYLKEL